jgi:Ca2+-binding EF-hand superfamily protein
VPRFRVGYFSSLVGVKFALSHGTNRVNCEKLIMHYYSQNNFGEPMHFKLLTPLFLIACQSSFAVAAAPTDKRVDAWLGNFARYDHNLSGGLSKRELEKSKANQFQGIKKHFDVMDEDKDGQVTRQEHAIFLQRQDDAPQETFKLADLDASGGLSKAELDKTKPKQFTDLKKRFATLDADKDGQVTPLEWRNRKTALITQLNTSDAWRPAFDRADVDDSGGLTRSELAKACPSLMADQKQAFDKADSDKDGQISVAEYQGYLNKSQTLKSGGAHTR